MKVIIAGSRIIKSVATVFSAIEKSGFEITEVVSGCAGGVDRIGELWAGQNAIPIKRFPAQWDDLSHPDAVLRTRSDGTQYDAKAGARRNAEMAAYGQALIAVWDGESRGTNDMVEQAQEKGLKIYLHLTP